MLARTRAARHGPTSTAASDRRGHESHGRPRRSLFEETYNLLNAWLSIVPGNGAHNLRRLAVLETNLADLSLFTLDHGDAVSPHLDRKRWPSSRRRIGRHAFNLRAGRRSHAGARRDRQRQELLPELPDHARAEVRAQTVVLDVGHSYRKLATLLGGRYLELGLRQHGVTINPFALEPTPEHLHFLHAFVRVLLEGTTGIASATSRTGRSTKPSRTSTCSTARSVALHVGQSAPSRVGGPSAQVDRRRPYASLFDNVDDTLTVERLQVFDFEAMRAYPLLLEPLLFYVLHRVVARIQDPAEASALKVCVMDEAWRFIQHPTLRAYVQEGLKTWRKRNAAMILATQTVEDFASADLLRTIVESCPTKLLLANPALDRGALPSCFS